MTPYPLAWPEQFPRAKIREKGSFKTALPAAIKNVQDSLRLFASDSRKPLADLVISSNVTLGVSRPAAMDGANVVADHAGGRIRELEAEAARLHRIDDERHARVCEMIGRRVTVEDALLRFAAGKRGPIEPDEAQRLALKLGVPDWFNDMVAEKAGAPREGGEETR